MRCPECGGEMEFHPAEPDVGIPKAWWGCPECGHDEDYIPPEADGD